MDNLIIREHLRPFTVGSNAGGGHGVLVEFDGLDRSYGGNCPQRRTKKVYRYICRSIGGRPRDTAEETADWLALRAAGLVA